jgi:c-di-GMP-binding flagellar brake protein YcgR
VFVEPVKQFMLISYSDHKPANAEMLAAKKAITCKCNHRGAQFAFSCNGPRQAVHERQPAIQLGMPTTMLALLHRRGLQRVQVPTHAQVDCRLRMGVLTFDAKLVDVSMDGMGFLLSEDALPLCAGTRLEGARVRHPQREPIYVDIEVRHVTRVTLPDGKRATRIGCRILAAPSDLEELIRLFIIDLQGE